MLNSNKAEGYVNKNQNIDKIVGITEQFAEVERFEILKLLQNNLKMQTDKFAEAERIREAVQLLDEQMQNQNQHGRE